jgi:carboxyl-terminal processing protease
MRVKLALWLGLMIVICGAHAQTAMHYYDQIQADRDQVDKLVDEQHPDAAHLKQAETILKHALDTLAQPAVMELAEGNASLLGRRYDTLRDLAGVYALEGRKDDALAALQAMQAEAWIPKVAELLRKEPEFANLRDEPRFKALLTTLDNAGRLWSADTLAVPYAPHLSEAQRIAGLSLFWSEVKYNFVHFDHAPDLDWDRTYLDFLPQVIAAKDTSAYYEVLMRLAPLLHDGHTNIYPPEELEGHFWARPPMRTALVQGHVLVTQIFSPTLERQGIHVGDEVLAIDDTEVHRYARERVAPYESSSTPQDADVRAYTYALLSGDENQPLTLRLRDASGATRDVEIARSDYRDIHSPPAFVFRMLPGDIAYLALDHFESDEGVKAFERHLPQIIKAKGLLLDVRKNGGGSTYYGLQILSYLSKKPIPVERSRELQIEPITRAQGALILHWHKPSNSGEPYVNAHAQHFAGPVAVLIGPRTFSAAEDFVVSFDAMKRGILVGQRTAGSTGQPLFFKLPGGGSARICVKRDTYPDGREFVGIGIAPQIEVAPTVADIRAGRDPVIEAAAAALLHEVPDGKSVSP